ncbi:MAG: hypothetical protein OER21_03180 [Gemmatimonadota bacterium]|nr:hypothetical protein [Gemmatimonadota bacterium]
MTRDDRRSFLKTLAAGLVYTAPVVASLAAPRHLLGQGESASKKCPQNPHCDTTEAAGASQQQQRRQSADPNAPWNQKPPGR